MRNLTFAALLLAAPLPALAQQSAPSTTVPAVSGTTAATPMPTTASEYLAMAASGDLYEKTSSQMMLETPQANATLRGFAQEMVQDHTETTNRLTQAAQRAGIAPGAPTMARQHQAMIEQLRAANGAQRDQIYLTQQMQAHEQALALHQTYAQRGDTPALREAAQLVAQAVLDHLQKLQRIRAGG